MAKKNSYCQIMNTSGVWIGTKQGKKVYKRNYWVRMVAGNGEILSHGETLNSKAAAFKQIVAHLKVFNGNFVLVCDSTLLKGTEPWYKVFSNGTKERTSALN